MNKQQTIHVLFAATSDYLPLATVTAVSIIENSTNKNIQFHFMYADIVKEILDKERIHIQECANETLAEYGCTMKFYNVAKYMDMFEGQNIGMWGKNISLTHYMYLLAPLVLKDINKVIYLDTDMIVNSDLCEVYNTDLKNRLIGMAEPRGQEEMGDDVSNSGFIVLNLELWKQENTLAKLLEFGRNLPKARFCDQWLLYQYFTINNPERLYLFDKSYNIFPQLFMEMKLSEIKIFHFTGWYNIKPWVDTENKQRAGFFWWKYARKTLFYEQFLLNNTKLLIHKSDENHTVQYNNIVSDITQKILINLKHLIINNIFSIRNDDRKSNKVITVLGIKFKFKKRRSNAKG